MIMFSEFSAVWLWALHRRFARRASSWTRRDGSLPSVMRERRGTSRGVSGPPGRQACLSHRRRSFVSRHKSGRRRIYPGGVTGARPSPLLLLLQRLLEPQAPQSRLVIGWKKRRMYRKRTRMGMRAGCGTSMGISLRSLCHQSLQDPLVRCVWTCLLSARERRRLGRPRLRRRVKNRQRRLRLSMLQFNA